MFFNGMFHFLFPKNTLRSQIGVKKKKKSNIDIYKTYTKLEADSIYLSILPNWVGKCLISIQTVKLNLKL